MKISLLISKLEEIKTKFGDISVTGGMMSDEVPLSKVTVTDTHGYQVWPTNDHPDDLFPVDGVFFE